MRELVEERDVWSLSESIIAFPYRARLISVVKRSSLHRHQHNHHHVSTLSGSHDFGLLWG